MFINHSHLPQLLSAWHYTLPDHFQAEIDRLFMPGWHCVGVTSEFSRDGDYKTIEIFDRPLIIWKMEGEYHAFLNVCAHRFSKLTDKPCGHSLPHLRCQYHGWEYDQSGNTRRIPDAKSFKPLKQGTLGLRRFRLETVGQLIFVTFSEGGPSLEEYLGPLYPMCQKWFTDDFVVVMLDDVSHEANWKVIVENFLESYHLNELHPHTFGEYPEERDCTHETHERWNRLKVDYSRDKKTIAERFACAMAGVTPTFTWQHLMRYPNIFYGQLALFNYIQMLFPESPTKCRIFTCVMAYPGRRGRVRSAVLAKMLQAWGGRFFPKVNAEDGRIFHLVQKGISAPRLPDGGLISTREERIFPFQKYVLEETGSDFDGPPEAMDAWRRDATLQPQESDTNGRHQEGAGHDRNGRAPNVT